MSMYLASDPGDPHFFASNRGWAETGAFIETLDDDNPLLHLYEHGYYEPASELATAVQELDDFPNENVQAVIATIGEFAADLDPDDPVLVTNGMAPAGASEEFTEDAIPGGKADGRPDSDFDADALAEGVQVELEHTDDPDMAREIAKDHLAEDPEYYVKLRKVEKHSEHWDESKHPRAKDGKFGKGGGGSSSAGSGQDTQGSPAKSKGVLATVAEAEHWVKGKVSAAVRKLPGPAQRLVRTTYEATMATFNTAWEAVSQYAEQKGWDKEKAGRMAAVLATVDLVAMKALPVALQAAGAGGLAVAGSSFIPVASAAYLGISLARDPMKTVKAAQNAVSVVWGRIKDAARGHAEEVWVTDLVDLYHEHDDRALALFTAALDLTRNPMDAVRVAKNALADGDAVTFAEEARQYDHCNTQFTLPDSVAARVLGLADRIKDDDLAAKGREDDPHVTVLYGITGDDVEPLRELLKAQAPIPVTLRRTSVFKNGDADGFEVVKLNVDSPALHQLHSAIKASMPFESTRPMYQPHVTVAYVKPGCGDKYAGLLDLEGRKVLLTKLCFCDRDGGKTTFMLGDGAKKFTEDFTGEKAPAGDGWKHLGNGVYRRRG